MSRGLELSQQAVSSAASASGKVAVGSGVSAPALKGLSATQDASPLMQYFADNAAAIGAICAVVSLLAMIAFNLVGLYMKKRMDEAYYKAKFSQEEMNE